VVQTRLTNSLKRFTILFRDFVCFKALRTVAGRTRALAHILLDSRPALRYSYVIGVAERMVAIGEALRINLLVLCTDTFRAAPA